MSFDHRCLTFDSLFRQEQQQQLQADAFSKQLRHQFRHRTRHHQHQHRHSVLRVHRHGRFVAAPSSIIAVVIILTTTVTILSTTSIILVVVIVVLARFPAFRLPLCFVSLRDLDTSQTDGPSLDCHRVGPWVGDLDGG